MVSLHLENIFLCIKGVVSPKFLVSFGAAELLISEDLSVLVLVILCVPYSAGSCSLLHVNTIIYEPCNFPNHANHGHELFLCVITGIINSQLQISHIQKRLAN